MLSGPPGREQLPAACTPAAWVPGQQPGQGSWGSGWSACQAARVCTELFHGNSWTSCLLISAATGEPLWDGEATPRVLMRMGMGWGTSGRDSREWYAGPGRGLGSPGQQVWWLGAVLRPDLTFSG